MPGAAGDAGENIVGAAEHPFRRAEQQGRIEIALHGAVVADALPGPVERNPPVNADDVAARLPQFREYR